MDGKKIRELWRMQETEKAMALEKWDDLAPEFAAFEMPTLENSAFMALAATENMLPPDGTALDVGCGAGRFTLAFAGGCRHVTGIDLSPKMIAYGKEKAEEQQIKNVDFFAADWHDFDLAAAGFEQAFDCVFAHMSPAIQNAETLEKMIRASKGWCALMKTGPAPGPRRRRHPLPYGEKRSRIGAKAISSMPSPCFGPKAICPASAIGSRSVSVGARRRKPSPIIGAIKGKAPVWMRKRRAQ